MTGLAERGGPAAVSGESEPVPIAGIPFSESGHSLEEMLARGAETLNAAASTATLRVSERMAEMLSPEAGE